MGYTMNEKIHQYLPMQEVEFNHFLIFFKLSVGEGVYPKKIPQNPRIFQI